MTTTQEWEKNKEFLFELIQENYDKELEENVISKEFLLQHIYGEVNRYKTKRFDMDLIDINKNIIKNIEQLVKSQTAKYMEEQKWQQQQKKQKQQQNNPLENTMRETSNMFGLYNLSIDTMKQQSVQQNEAVTHEDLIMERKRTLDEVYQRKKNEMNSMLVRQPPEHIDFSDSFDTNDEDIDSLMEKEMKKRELEQKDIMSKISKERKDETNQTIETNTMEDSRNTIIKEFNTLKENRTTNLLTISEEEVNLDKDVKKLKPKKVSFDLNSTYDTDIQPSITDSSIPNHVEASNSTLSKFMKKLNTIQNKKNIHSLDKDTVSESNQERNSNYNYSILKHIVSSIEEIKKGIQEIKHTLQIDRHMQEN